MITIFNHQTQKNLDTSLVQETFDIMKDYSIPCSIMTNKGFRNLFSRDQAMDKIDKKEYMCSKHNNSCAGFYRGTNETFPRVYLDCILCSLEEEPFEDEVERNRKKRQNTTCNSSDFEDEDTCAKCEEKLTNNWVGLKRPPDNIDEDLFCIECANILKEDKLQDYQHTNWYKQYIDRRLFNNKEKKQKYLKSKENINGTEEKKVE